MPERFRKAAKAHAPVVTTVLQILSGSWEQPDFDAVVDGLKQSEAAVADLIRAGQAAGVVRRALDPPTAARDWLRYLFGLELLRPAEADDHPPPDADVLVHGLMKTDV